MCQLENGLKLLSGTGEITGKSISTSVDGGKRRYFETIGKPTRFFRHL
jgi:hypothetical protein